MSQKQQAADERLLVALLAGATIVQAAKDAALSERTVARRLRSDAFRRRLVDARAQNLQQTASMLSRTAVEAAAQLRELLSDESPSVRLAAAKAILENFLKCHATLEIEDRLAAIEEIVVRSPSVIRGPFPSAGEDDAA